MPMHQKPILPNIPDLPQSRKALGPRCQEKPGPDGTVKTRTVSRLPSMDRTERTDRPERPDRMDRPERGSALWGPSPCDAAN